MTVHTATIITPDSEVDVAALKEQLIATGWNVYMESAPAEIDEDQEKAITIMPTDRSAYEIDKSTKL